jgi:hypothetical protein
MNKNLEKRAGQRFAIVLHLSLFPSLILPLTKRGGKARAKADDDDAGSVDSMAMDVDEPGSEFGSDPARPPPGKKNATTRGKKAAPPTASRKKASGSGRGKVLVSRVSFSAIMMWFIQV